MLTAIELGAPDAIIARFAKALVPGVALVLVIFTLRAGDTIVALLLMGYCFVTHLFPALAASLLPRNLVTREGAFGGVCFGIGTVAATSLAPTDMAVLLRFLPEALSDLNIGVVALMLNVVTLAIVSAVTRRRPIRAFSS